MGGRGKRGHVTGGSAWATDYESSEHETDFAYLAKYSPLHNEKAGTCNPATLVTTADHDDRVVPSHSFKFAATDKRIAELADEWAFALANMNARTPATAAR